MKFWLYRLEDISIQSYKKKFSLTLACNFKWLWPPFVKSFCTMDFELKEFCVEELIWKSWKKIQKITTWFAFFKKLLRKDSIGSRLEKFLNC